MTLEEMKTQHSMMIEALEKIYELEPLLNMPDFMPMKIAAEVLDIVKPVEGSDA